MLQVLTHDKNETERKILETSAVWLKLKDLEGRIERLETPAYAPITPEFKQAVAKQVATAPEYKHIHNVCSMFSSRFPNYDVGEKAKRSYVQKLKGFDVTDLMSAAMSIINDIPPFMEPNEQMIIDRCEVYKSRRFQDAAVLDSIRAVKLQISNQTRQASGYLNGAAK